MSPLVLYRPTLIWGCVFLYLQSPKCGRCSLYICLVLDFLSFFGVSPFHNFVFMSVKMISWCDDWYLSIGRHELRTSIYDKRDDFIFHVKHFLFLSSNFQSSPANGVFISQLTRFARACSFYECFIRRVPRLSHKLLEQGYFRERLKSFLRKFYGRNGDPSRQFEVSLFQMLHDILGVTTCSDTLHCSDNSLDCDLVTEFDLITDFCLIKIREVSIKHFETDAACQQFANRGCLFLRKPDPVLFWDLYMF